MVGSGRRAADDHPLAPGVEPAVIREHLLRAVANADENAQWHFLERWRGIAMIQSDRESVVAWPGVWRSAGPAAGRRRTSPSM